MANLRAGLAECCRIGVGVAAHRALAVRWLATLHAMASQLDLANRLPPENPESYLRYLNAAREPILASSDMAAWDAACLYCATMPHCLVHAYFVNKNVLVTRRRDCDQLMALDWGIAGWGASAPDPEHINPFALVRTTWLAIRISDVAALKTIGTLMRHLGLIEVRSSSLRDHLEWTIERLNRRLSSHGSPLLYRGRDARIPSVPTDRAQEPLS
jgi:hypothetical protein